MNSRYLTNIGLAITGGFAIVVSQVFGVPVFMWLMLGAGVVALALSAAAALPTRGRAQRALDGTVAVIGAWTILASLIFTGTAVTWLGLGGGVCRRRPGRPDPARALDRARRALPRGPRRGLGAAVRHDRLT